MKEFKPSDNFISRVMNDVRNSEKTRKADVLRPGNLILSGGLGYVMSAGGLILGIWNLFRIYFSVFAPAICR